MVDYALHGILSLALGALAAFAYYGSGPIGRYARTVFLSVLIFAGFALSAADANAGQRAECFAQKQQAMTDLCNQTYGSRCLGFCGFRKAESGNGFEGCYAVDFFGNRDEHWSQFSCPSCGEAGTTDTHAPNSSAGVSFYPDSITPTKSCDDMCEIEPGGVTTTADVCGRNGCTSGRYVKWKNTGELCGQPEPPPPPGRHAVHPVGGKEGLPAVA